MNSLVPDLAIVPKLFTKSVTTKISNPQILETIISRTNPQYHNEKLSHLTSFGHSYTTVNNGQRVVCLVRNDMDEQLRLPIELALVCQTLKTDLVQGLH